jgi:hypothetical protein
MHVIAMNVCHCTHVCPKQPCWLACASGESCQHQNAAHSPQTRHEAVSKNVLSCPHWVREGSTILIMKASLGLERTAPPRTAHARQHHHSRQTRLAGKKPLAYVPPPSKTHARAHLDACEVVLREGVCGGGPRGEERVVSVTRGVLRGGGNGRQGRGWWL